MKRVLTPFLTLGLLAGSLVAAQTYKIQLSDPVHAGQAVLKPGKYLLEVDGSNAVLKDKAGNTIDVKAKVEQTSQKAAVTFVGMSGVDGEKKLDSVIPEGSQVRVVFE
jgi:hypothetical protein